MGAKRKSSSKSERGTPVKKPNAAGVEPIISNPEETSSSNIEEEDIIAERCNLHLHSELPVIAMAYSTKVKRLCVLRRMEQENTNADGPSQKLLTSIEFYNAANPPLIFLEKSIPLFNSLNSLFWMTSWAVLGGTGGNLYFFSPYTSKYAKMQISSTELTSLVRLSNEEFVVANNSGDVTLFSRHKQDLDEEENLLPRIMGHTLVKLSADSHILSLACSKKSPNQMIAIGQVNSITLFALQSMRRHDIKIPSLKNKSTVIWSMVFVDDVLFVGDSLGQVTLYNAVNGLLLKTFKSHQNDVLSLAMDGANVFSSGADSRIQVFARSGNSKQMEWQEVGQRLFHTKDVRSLCVLSTKWLVSGGYDGFYISGKHAFCKPHLRPECAFSNKQGLLLTRNPTSIDVWYKPQQDTKILANSVLRYEICRLWPKLLTRIAIGTLGFVKQATISPNGCFIAFVGNINGTIMVLQLPRDFAAKVIESAKNNGKTTQQMKRQKEEPPANGFIRKYWSNRSEQESGEAVGGGRAVSAIFCTDNFLFYVLGEYSLFRLDLATKKTEMFATAKGGHITKIGANQLGTLVVALTTDGSALLFRLDPPNPYQFSPPSSMSTATPLIRDQAAYDCAFLGESRVLLLTSDLAKHLVCFDLTKMGECFVLSATDLHLCEMESFAYMDVVATEQTQILATTNKGRVLTLNVADNDGKKKPDIYISGQSEDLKLLPGKLDSRIEPFWGRKEESGRCREIVLVGHVEEAQIRQNKKK